METAFTEDNKYEEAVDECIVTHQCIEADHRNDSDQVVSLNISKLDKRHKAAVLIHKARIHFDRLP